ncbi:UDP-N-acetylglucosamine 2-epimerase [Minicystis rosea]|nr:UDP-N-acetylglucosamine 2-epimerase [Minicystis rosea]
MKQRAAIIVGTRPEAIKMAPVVRALAADGALAPVLISTGQHRELLASALRPLELTPDHDLEVMTPGQTPSSVTARVLDRLPPLLDQLKPAVLLVQGDTTTAFAAGLAAYYQRIPVGHVEAGLRTYDHEHPFPEEANRQLVARISTWCFAPTELSRDNLLAERIAPERVIVTGNTAVDALLWAVSRSHERCPEGTVLITLHRRESFGEPLHEIALGVRDFLEATPGAHALWPVHPNPNVGRVLDDVLGTSPRVTRRDAMEYVAFTGVLASCRLVLTDSGGLQEEAPSLGKTVLIARETTERPEALASGRNRLTGRTRAGVREALLTAWNEPAYAGPLPAPNPFGDGKAAERIVAALRQGLGV